MEREIPVIQTRHVSLRRRTTFLRDITILNRFGEELNLAGMVLQGSIFPDMACICPKVMDFCVEESPDNCNKIRMTIDARQSEKLKCKTYYFTIEVNPRDPIETLDRPLKIMEVEMLGADPSIPFKAYENYMLLEPYLPAAPTFRLVEGTIEVLQ